MAQAQNSSGAAPLTVSVGVHCHPGKVREDNQDRISRFATPLGDFFLVADGVGGNRGGAEASRMVEQGYAQCLALVSRDAEPIETLRAVSNQINGEIYATGHSANTQLQNMGSTVAFVLFRGNAALIGHVGDSRVYHVRDGQLSRVTHDHSAVQKLLDHGLLTETQARDHPDASVLTRSFGQKPEVEVDFDNVALRPGDALLLCSDGLWGCVTDKEIAGVIASPSSSVQACADGLLDLALRAGGPDNISIEYLRFSGDLANTADSGVTPAKNRRVAAIVLGSLVVVSAAIYGGWELSTVYHRRGATQSAVRTALSPTAPTRTSETPEQTATPRSGPSAHPTAPPLNRTPSTIPPTGSAVPDSPPPGPHPDHSGPPVVPTLNQPVEYGARVGVLLPRSRSIDWIVILRRVGGAKVQPILDPDHQCASQAQDQPMAYYSPPHKQVASAIGVAWSAETALKEMTPAIQNACGTYDIVVLPAERDL